MFVSEVVKKAHNVIGGDWSWVVGAGKHHAARSFLLRSKCEGRRRAVNAANKQQLADSR